ncbi:unnamed protein product [Fusarium graminearum]|nr:unnamed protein product [Fusarium graminearum]
MKIAPHTVYQSRIIFLEQRTLQPLLQRSSLGSRNVRLPMKNASMSIIQLRTQKDYLMSTAKPSFSDKILNPLAMRVYAIAGEVS